MSLSFLANDVGLSHNHDMHASRQTQHAMMAPTRGSLAVIATIVPYHSIADHWLD
jgi:hypothetical protein